ncbi:MAG: UDP-N-acetylmuramate--L-alanine ligase [Magnetococcales bacterium]|nr:UDP-N-acetylmuramate--L-alanine ligase [Magnetococcales bacterium]
MYEKINRLHFVGIGGIGMSGIAEVLINLGYVISGSDMAENANVRRLRNLGATVHIGHAANQVGEAHAVVTSSAVTADNPEVAAARHRRIPVVPRAEMLAELMRFKYSIAIAGTHGKTTTTSLIATLLGEAGMDPTVVNGGIVKSMGSNARLGRGEFLVTEADESDGSFLKLFPTMAVVTNMDPEHMEHYGHFDAVRRAFREFVSKVPFYGLIILCRDHPEVRAMLPDLGDKRVVTYGLQPGADIRAVDVVQEGVHTHFRVEVTADPDSAPVDWGPVALSLPGLHNVTNTLAAIAVAWELAIPWETVIHALAGFRGVQRRFDLLFDSPERVVIDDYGHHPVEIQATLAAVRAGFGRERRLVVAFQPHRYTRVRDHFQAFAASFVGTDLVLVDPIYPAGETPPSDPPLGERGQEMLMTAIREQSQTRTAPLPGGPEWIAALTAYLEPGDIVVFLGAGNITQRARAFAGSLSGE